MGEVVKTICGMCTLGCGIDVSVQDGRIERIEGSLQHPANRGIVCSKAHAARELVSSPERLKYPMKKKGNEWERISWDEALEHITTELNRIKLEHGAQSMAVYQGCPVALHDVGWYAKRFCNLYETPNYSSAGSLCHFAGVMGNILTFGAYSVPDYENSNCIVLWGANPSSSMLPHSKSISHAKRRGAKLIVVDPRSIPLAVRADVHLRPRPGTDMALALGMLNIVVTEGLYDKDFVKEWTVGFDKLEEHLKDYPPEKVKGITGVEAHDIRKAAELYATTKPACTNRGIALDHSPNAVQGFRALSILQAITGNLDVPGGDLFGGSLPLTVPGLENRETNSKPIGEEEHSLFVQFTSEAQAMCLPETLLSCKPYPIKSMLILGSNPVLTWPQARKTQEALKKLDFLVVMDIFMTQTAELANIVLPAATFLERDEFFDYGLFGIPYAMLRRKVVAPRGESWPDWKFWFELAQRMGYKEYFPWQDVREAIGFQLSPTLVTIEELEKNTGGMFYQTVKHRRYVEAGFRTPSQNVELYSERLKKLGHDPLPVYREEKKGEEFTLILSTGARIPGYFHSQFRNLPGLRKTALDPEAEIHPETAKERGIENSQNIVIESPQGAIETKAKVTSGIVPEVISIAHGWNQSNANILTNSDARDPISGFPEMKGVSCQVRRLEA
ncbi:MAG: molybdopterin-dependent oxidoreductase [Thermodesulfobacteriota bacterium]|nr:molybdopterin-dependent oxidoreductase [Thermodesulfobacteriota bacterium]